MDTVILAEDDSKIERAFEQFPIAPPRSGLCRVLRLPKVAGSRVYKQLGENRPLIDLGIAEFVCLAISSFARESLERIAKRKNRPRSTAHTLQVIVVFHQRHTAVANSIATGLLLLGSEATWSGLINDFRVGFRVANVWLLSCESAADASANDMALRNFYSQAVLMRRAAATGLMTPTVSLPGEKLKWFNPAVYTFSSGSTILGGVTSHPNHVSFFEVQDYALRGTCIVETGQSREKVAYHTNGKIYKHVNGERVRTCVVPKGKEVDLIRFPPQF
jgi:hypothetical protein